jgi:hypothetical protein
VAQPRVAAVVTGAPFSVELTLPLPDRTELEALRQRAGDPALTSAQQAVAQQGFRVAEVLYEKQNASRLAVLAAVPIICARQERFLLGGNETARVDVSLAEVAAQANFPVHVVASGIRNFAVRSPAGLVALDDLVGLGGNGPFSLPVRDTSPTLLIPTDRAGDKAAYAAFVRIFREGRQRVLDPVFIVEDPEIFPRAYVVQGHHRTAAALTTEHPVRTASLRKKEHLQHLAEGLAADTAAACATVSDFVAVCRNRSRELGLYAQGWSGWLASLE